MRNYSLRNAEKLVKLMGSSDLRADAQKKCKKERRARQTRVTFPIFDEEKARWGTLGTTRIKHPPKRHFHVASFELHACAEVLQRGAERFELERGSAVVGSSGSRTVAEDPPQDTRALAGGRGLFANGLLDGLRGVPSELRTLQAKRNFGSSKGDVMCKSIV
jgi:hypothetical protein